LEATIESANQISSAIVYRFRIDQSDVSTIFWHNA